MKMKIIWDAEAREPREWTVDRQNPAWDVCYPVETVTGLGWLPLLERLDAMSPIAWRALLWALRKIDEPRLPIETIEINWDELSLRVLCPGCDEWVLPQGHECDFTALEAAEQPDETATEQAKRASKKKAGAPDPEA